MRKVKQTSLNSQKKRSNCSIAGIKKRYKELNDMSDIGTLPTGNKHIDQMINATYNRTIDILPIPKYGKFLLKKIPSAPQYGAKAARIKQSIQDLCRRK